MKGGKKMKLYGYYEEVNGRVKQVSVSDNPLAFADLMSSSRLNHVTPRLLKGEGEELAKLMSMDEIGRKGLLVTDVAKEIKMWRESGLSRGPEMEARVNDLLALGEIQA